MDSPAVVVDYDPRWVQDFLLIRERLQPALPRNVAIEHVGSTAVPGLAAKPIIDVDVVLSADLEIPGVVAALESMGYEHRGNLGIAGREAFSVLPGLPYHHLYVVVAESPAYNDHVDLRDYLRVNRVVAERYTAEKQRLAHLLPTDREAYLRGKGWLVEELLAAARSTGVPPPG